MVHGWPFRLSRIRRRCLLRSGSGWRTGSRARWPTPRRRPRIGGGADFWVYGLHFSGPGLPPQWTVPLVARIPPVPERFVLLERESRLQAWVATQGYPVPPVLDLVPPGELLEFPVQVTQRLAGTTMAAAAAAAPWRIRRLAGLLAACQAALHRLPAPGWAMTGHGWTLAGNRLRLARYLVQHGPPAGLAQALEHAERLLPLLEVPGPVICHGDFQPANLISDLPVAVVLVDKADVFTCSCYALVITDAGPGPLVPILQDFRLYGARHLVSNLREKGGLSSCAQWSRGQRSDRGREVGGGP